MKNRNFGVLILGLLLLVSIFGIVSVNASPIGDTTRNTCKEYCVSNGFNSGTDATDKKTCEKTEKTGDAQGYFRTYTDKYETGGNPQTKQLSCCCSGGGVSYSRKGDNTFSSGSTGFFDNPTTNIGGWFFGWEQGKGIDTTFIKYLFLILIFVLIYSAFGFMKFPEQASMRAVLAIVVSLLFTLAINPKSILAIMISWNAAGVTMILFFPMVVLAFFSFVVATNVNAMGIVLQRVLWGMYSIFLFISSGSAWLGNIGNVAPDSFFVWIFEIFEKISGSYFSGADITILITLFVASIIIFFTMVLNNKFFIGLLVNEVAEAKLQRYGQISKKSEAKKKVDAAAVDNA